MTIEKNLALDLKKITEEDRRFLLNQTLNRAIRNSQGSASNIALFLSFLAILISSFSVIYQTKNFLFIEIFLFFSGMGILFFLFKFKKAKENLTDEISDLKISYEQLLKYHLDYAKK